MGARKVKILFVAGLILFIIARLFCGVFEHDEFGSDVYFIKHRPIWKWRFYSPRGMSDLKLNQMTDKQKNEQLLFDEFVEKRIIR
jgi:hypothetical protein